VGHHLGAPAPILPLPSRMATLRAHVQTFGASRHRFVFGLERPGQLGWEIEGEEAANTIGG
jgi:hypothetical protein